MQCVACGNSVTPGSAFCQVCGRPQAGVGTGQGQMATPGGYPQYAPGPGYGQQVPGGTAPSYGSGAPGGYQQYGAPNMGGGFPTAPVPAKKSKKGLIIGLVAGGLVVIGAGVGAGLYFLMDWSNPQEDLYNNVVNTNKQFMAGQRDAVKNRGIEPAIKEVREGKAEIELRAGLPIDTDGDFEKVNIDGTINTNLADSQVEMLLNIGLDDAPIAEVPVYVEDNKMAIGLTDMMDGFLEIDTETFGEAYSNSVIATAAEESGSAPDIPADLQFNVPDSVSNLVSPLVVSGAGAVSDKTVGSINKATETLLKTTEIAKPAEKKAALKPNVTEDYRDDSSKYGATRELEEYKFTVKQADFIKYLRAVTDAGIADQGLGIDSIESLLTSVGHEFTGEGIADEVSSAIDDMAESTKGNVNVEYVVTKGYISTEKYTLTSNNDDYDKYTISINRGVPELAGEYLSLAIKADDTEMVKVEMILPKDLVDGQYYKKMTVQFTDEASESVVQDESTGTDEETGDAGTEDTEPARADSGYRVNNAALLASKEPDPDAEEPATDAEEPGDGESAPGKLLVVETTYDPESDADNLVMTITAGQTDGTGEDPAESVEITGTLIADGKAKTVSIDLPELVIEDQPVPFYLSIQPQTDGEDFAYPDDVTVLFDMDEAELEELMTGIMEKAQNDENLMGLMQQE